MNDKTRMERKLIAYKVYGVLLAVLITAGVTALVIDGVQAAAENREPPIIYEPQEAVVEMAAEDRSYEPVIEEEAPPQEELEEPEEVFEKEAQPRKVLESVGTYYITGYDICVKCCGKTDGVTASGALAEVGRTVAAPKDIPFGTVLYIEGIGERVVEDRGVTGRTLDVLCNDHSECYAITGSREVYIIKEVWD